MLLGGSLLGTSLIGKYANDEVESAANQVGFAADELEEKQNSQPIPSLDVHDITIDRLSVHTYIGGYDRSAEVSIIVSNNDRRKYSVQIPVFITNKDGDRLHKIEKFKFKIQKSGLFEGEMNWGRHWIPKNNDSSLRAAENPVIRKVTVKRPGFFNGSHKDVTDNPEEVIQDEK